MEDKTRKTLKLFVEKACLLRERNFAQHVRENGLTTTVKFGPDSQIKHTIPDRESIESSILTTRMFFQNKDSISFCNVAKLLDDSNLSDGFKENFTEKRGELNSYLDGVSGINFNEKTITNRKIFEVFVYGDLAHSNEKERAVYLDWKRHKLFIVLEQAFAIILMDILELIWKVSDAVESELEGK